MLLGSNDRDLCLKEFQRVSILRNVGYFFLIVLLNDTLLLRVNGISVGRVSRRTGGIMLTGENRRTQKKLTK